MKLNEVKEKLKNKYPKFEYKHKKIDNMEKNQNRYNGQLQIIGITGSYGKTTTAILVHKYLKMLGYRSILYSSSLVESPISFKSKNDAFEIALDSEETLLEIIEESELYDADFLVLEINEMTIEKDFLNDIPFTVRVLTNLNPKHNLELYTEEEYVTLKKLFFTNIDENCKCVFGFQNYKKDLFEEFKVINNSEKYFFSSGHVAEIYGLDKKDLFCELTHINSDLDGLNMTFKLNDNEYSLSTSLIMPYTSLNILCACTILKVLNLFDYKKFQTFIKDVKIPGRLELIKVKNRFILIDLNLTKTLEALKQFKDERKLVNIRVVVGAVGVGFKRWNDCFKTDKYLNQHTKNKKYAMDFLVNNADKVYLTENDNAAQSVLEICQELSKYIDNRLETEIIENRYSAIKKAITDSEEGDVIFISGRGNRSKLCHTKNNMKFIKDIDIVKKILEEIEL